MSRSWMLLSLFALVACSPTQRSLKRAAKALAECDIRTAHTEFDDAFTRSPDNLDAAMGFALTDLALLPEDPHFNGALLALGFRRKIDAQDLLYGEDALLERLSDSDACEDIDELLSEEIAYPPLWGGDDTPADLVEDGVTLDDVLDELSGMKPRLQRTADALATAADLLEEPYAIELEGSCGSGIGAVSLQAPELYAAAAALTALRGAILAAEGYDWDMELSELFREGGPQADLLNDHLFHIADEDRLKDAGAVLSDAVALADEALAQASRVEDTPDDPAFDWSELDVDFISDLREIGDAARQSLEGSGMEDVPYWEPALQADPGALFSDPPDASTLSRPLFRGDNRFAEADYDAFAELFSPYFDRDIFRSDDEYWTLGDRWESLEIESALNPDDRYSDNFECD